MTERPTSTTTHAATTDRRRRTMAREKRCSAVGRGAAGSAAAGWCVFDIVFLLGDGNTMPNGTCRSVGGRLQRARRAYFAAAAIARHTFSAVAGMSMWVTP